MHKESVNGRCPRVIAAGPTRAAVPHVVLVERRRSDFWLLAALAVLWVVAGLTGHEPWKPDEAYTFGLVQHIRQTGDVLVPTLTGQPFLEKPPLYFATAALFQRIFEGWLTAHDAARLATGLYLGLTLWWLWLAERELRGRGALPFAPLLLIGTIGLFEVSHRLQTDIALLSGFSMALYALALARRAPRRGGSLLGGAIAVTFLSKGLLGPGLIALSSLVLVLLTDWHQWLKKSVWAWALGFALPVCLLWPVALYRHSPTLFDDWFWLNNLGRFAGTAALGPKHEPWFYTKTLPWFAFPLLPLAAFGLYRMRWDPSSEDKIWVALPAVFAGVTLAVLACAHDARAIYALPLLPPLALLGSVGVGRLEAQIARRLNDACRFTFGLAALLLWLGWLVLFTRYPSFLAVPLLAQAPGYVEPLRVGALAWAGMVSVGWILVQGRIGGAAHAVAWNWAAGMTLIWCLCVSLWMPLVDYTKSYRQPFLELKQELASTACVGSRGLGESERAMLSYYAGVVTRREETVADPRCDVLLVQSRAGEVATAAPGWQLVWSGRRPGERQESFQLFRRVHAPLD